MPAPEQPSPIVLSVNAIVEGKFIHAGTALPFTSAADLPESLKPFIARGDETPFQAAARNIYDMPPPLRRQAWKLETIAQEKEAAEEEADAPLREDIQAALQAEHDLRIGAALQQARFNQAAIDNAHEAAAEAAQPREFFVKRGGEMGRTDRCRLKPGELIFARTPTGEYEVIGHTNSNAEIPNELTYDIQT